MDIRVLRYFLTIVQEENLSKAAIALYMTQPTLSRQMADLEKELGTTLFIRGKKIELTEDGMLLYHRAKEIVELTDKAKEEIRENKGDLRGVLSLGMGGQFSFSSLTPLLIGFQKEHPKVQYDLYTNSAQHLLERLDKGLLDFALLLEPVDIQKYDYLRLKDQERWGLLVSVSSPLAGKERIEKEDLLKTPLMTTSRLSLQKEFNAWLGQDFKKLTIVGTYNLLINAVHFVKEGHLAALTIEGATLHYDPKELRFIPLSPSLSMTSVLAYRSYQPQSRIAKAFLSYLTNALEA